MGTLGALYELATLPVGAFALGLRLALGPCVDRLTGNALDSQANQSAGLKVSKGQSPEVADIRGRPFEFRVLIVTHRFFHQETHALERASQPRSFLPDTEAVEINGFLSSAK